MTTSAHVCFADVPLSPVASQEGHRSTFACDTQHDATPQQRQTRDRSISPVAPPDCSSPVLSTSPRYERNMGFFRQLSRRFGLRSNDDLVYSGSNEDDNQSSSTDSCSSHAGAAKGSSKELPKQFTSCNSSETSSTVDIEEQQTQLPREQQSQPNTTVPDTSNADDASGEDKPPNYQRDRKSFARSSFSRLQRRSTNSIRRAFEAFSLSSRSLSCSGATPPPPPLLSSQSHTSSASSSTNNGTPIKSALKSSSNLELNKKSATFAIAAKPSSLRRTSSAAASPTIAVTSSSSSSSTKTKTKPPPQRILRQPVSYTYLKGISGLPTQRVPRNAVCCQHSYVRR